MGNPTSCATIREQLRRIVEEINCCGAQNKLKEVKDVDRDEITYLITCETCKGTMVLKKENSG